MRPHWHDIDIAGPGPSPWYRCSRPSCRLIYRTIAFTRATPPACPMCGQPYLCARLPRMPLAQREAVSA